MWLLLSSIALESQLTKDDYKKVQQKEERNAPFTERSQN